MRANAQGFAPATARGKLIATAIAATLFGGVVAGVMVSAAGHGGGTDRPGKALWSAVSDKLPAARDGAEATVRPTKLDAFELDRSGLQRLLESAPAATDPAGKARDGLVVSLPRPDGTFERFSLSRSDVMAPGLAAKHPEIATFSGVGLDDKHATIHADVSPLGFHASVRTPTGAWYIDPYYLRDDSVHASYFGRDVPGKGTLAFVERDADSAELSVDKGYYLPSDTVTLSGAGFAHDAAITITISDPTENFAMRTVSAQSDNLGGFEASFVADPGGSLETHIVEAGDGESSASTSYEVVKDFETTDPPTGDFLRTYRLALVTDPGYASYFGAANVTSAKVTLVNRVSQVYEDELSIKLQLVENNDLLNFNDYARTIGPNGPCGIAACYTLANVSSCQTGRQRIVISQVIGASNYDIGHLALGQPGGGVAALGVVGRQNKAAGCTGLATPDGDFFAIDYVAHEMGHQFSGNHTFNGTQLNCSGGNRNAPNSVEPGSGSSIQAYAGICYTDDLQAHSDPYFSQRSLQEISTYTTSNQAAANEVQTASLRHFGGGNEVQVVTFGPGYAPTATVQPLSVNIAAAPSATSSSLGGAQEVGNTVTIQTGTTVTTLQPGDTVTIAGVPVAGYNGTFTVETVPTTRSFTYTNQISGLPVSGGGTVTLAAPGATEVGNTATIRTAASHGRSVGDIVVITGSGAYNGTWTITAVPTPRSFEFTHTSSGLAASGGGTVTYFSPFQVRIGGNDSAVIGGSAQPYTAPNIQAAINAIPGFAGTVTVTGATGTGFTVMYGGPSANTDVANFSLQNLSCGGCFSSVEETTHGGANDSFKLNFNGNVSAAITNGTNYTAAGIQAALLPLLPAGGTATVAGFGGGAFNNTGFQVTFGGALAATNVASLMLQDFSAGASGFVGETDKGGAVDNKGGPGLITPTGNTWPDVSAPAEYTIPLRTPFSLTGSATDAEGDPLLYSWEQNDRGGAAGTTLLLNNKANGPLFAMFPKSGQISLADSLLYNSPGQNHLTDNPTRVFPDLQQIVDNNTNADTGSCPPPPIAPPVPQAITECYAEFLPTLAYVGFAGTNAIPLSLHFRFTVRDGRGGVNAGDTAVLLASTAGPFRVTGPGPEVAWTPGSNRTVTWDVAGTDVAPVSTVNVKISLSLDGGLTYPIVLAASTPNDGSHAVLVPGTATLHARVKVEAVGNVFFDISNEDFVIAWPGVVGLDSIGLTGASSLIDSYHSSAGPYGGSNMGSKASVFSNGPIGVGGWKVYGEVRSAASSVTVGPGGLVTGDVRAGKVITNQGTIQGAMTPNSPSAPLNAPAVPACSPYSSAAGISGGFSYNAATGDLTISGGRTTTLAAGTYCFRNVSISGGARLNTSGQVVIVLNGALTASGSSRLNDGSKLPTDLRIASSYAGANGVTVSGGGTVYASIYVPRTGIVLSGGAKVFGALLGKTLTASGGSAVHSDLQLVPVWAQYFEP